MSHDGLPARAVTGARAARTDRGDTATDRLSLLRHAVPAALTGIAVIAIAACNAGSSSSPASSAAASTGTTTSSAEASTGASTEASSSAAASGGATSGFVAVVFAPMNGSQVLGGATIRDQADGSSAEVLIGIGSTDATDGMTAVLQQGACASAGASGAPGASGSPAASGAGASAGASAAASAPAASVPPAGGSAAPSGSGEAASAAPSPVSGPPYQLTPLTGGASTTLVATTVSAVTSEPYSIVLSKSATDMTPIACGDVVPGGTQPAGSSSAPSTEPSMGTEPSASSS